MKHLLDRIAKHRGKMGNLNEWQVCGVAEEFQFENNTYSHLHFLNFQLVENDSTNKLFFLFLKTFDFFIAVLFIDISINDESFE